MRALSRKATNENEKNTDERLRTMDVIILERRNRITTKY